MISFLVITFFFGFISGHPASFNNVKIIGGDNISIQEVPYQVSLEDNGNHFCGGSIISPNYIVTSAHCTSLRNASTISVRAGTSTRGVEGQVINVSKINSHPNFNEKTVDCDIAVLELSANLTFDLDVAAITLPVPDQTWPVGTEVLVTGWGVLSMESTELATELQGVTVNIIDQVSCKSTYGEDVITDNMLCAGVDSGAKGACQGDNGGPLQVDGVLAGVVSFGIGCGLPEYPGVFARVSALRSFIQDVTGL